MARSADRITTSSVRSVRNLLAIVSPVIVVLALTQPGLALTWKKGFVDPGSIGSAPTSIALDAANTPHFCYYESSALPLLDALKYASWNRSAESWEKEVVASSSDGTIGDGCSIAVEPSGNPHISYYNGSRGAIEYATKEAAGWNRDTVAVVGEGWTDSAIAVDSTGTPHVSYYNPSRGAIEYAVKEGTVWNRDTVAVVGEGRADSAIAVDPNGIPQIAYYNPSRGTIEYAVKEGSVWNRETIDDRMTKNAVAWTSLAVDASGTPHVAYLHNAEEILLYARKEAAAWNRDTVDGDTGSVGVAQRHRR